MREEKRALKHGTSSAKKGYDSIFDRYNCDKGYTGQSKHMTPRTTEWPSGALSSCAGRTSRCLYMPRSTRGTAAEVRSMGVPANAHRMRLHSFRDACLPFRVVLPMRSTMRVAQDMAHCPGE